MDASTMGGTTAMFGSEGITGLIESKQAAHFTTTTNNNTTASTSSPRPSSPAFYDDSVDWNFAQLSPVETASSCSDRTSSHVRNESNPMNAVHMHVQENARIPNYNRPVDRSNSSIYKTVPRSTYNNSNTTSSDAMLSSNREQENSMAEIFLSSESKYRKSLNEAYEVIGSLEDNFQREIDELATVSVDPTPWSEIKTKMDIEEENQHHQQQQHQRQHEPQHQQEVPQSGTTATAPAPAPESVDPGHPHQSSYYPYGRHHQLPIPERSSPLPRQNSSPNPNGVGQGVTGLAEAIATAAAIACTTDTVGGVVDGGSTEASSTLPATNKVSAGAPPITAPAPGLPRGSNNPSLLTNNPTTPTQSNTTAAAKTRGVPVTLPNRHLQRRPNATNPSAHAAAHTVPRASVVAATNRKSQYGFGGNHTVPSVPAPPSIRSAAIPKPVARKPQPPVTKKIVAPASTTISTTAPITMPPPAAPPQIPMPIPSLLPNGAGQHPPTLPPAMFQNSGSAYERKKQKAKDARIKLNESIERLSIAVSLAGSQSRSRIEQLEHQIMKTTGRQKSIQVNQEGIKFAENAKKWDRPSFVGTAASIIQSLNAQCEALMAELMAMQEMVGASNGEQNAVVVDDGQNPPGKSSSSTADATTDVTMGMILPEANGTNNAAIVASVESSNSNNLEQQDNAYSSPKKRQEQPVHVAIPGSQTSNKRPRVETTVTPENKPDQPSEDEIIYGSVAKLLDPVSLCRCARVSKKWRDMKVFQDNSIWLDLAVKRFGVYNVRQWSENLNDGEDEEDKISNKNIYKEMNASNVMPHFSQEGLSLLGNGKIEGKISGWVFIVERSNGETLRSVKRDPDSGTLGGGKYRSMPVVELRIVVQNTGMANNPVILKSQKIGVDISTRRRGGELVEIGWDDRLKKVVRNLDGKIRPLSTKSSSNDIQEDLCSLDLFQAAVIEVHINAKGCSTTSKFQQKSNFTKLLAYLEGTTVPMVIPFLKDD